MNEGGGELPVLPNIIDIRLTRVMRRLNTISSADPTLPSGKSSPGATAAIAPIGEPSDKEQIKAYLTTRQLDFMTVASNITDADRARIITEAEAEVSLITQSLADPELIVPALKLLSSVGTASFTGNIPELNELRNRVIIDNLDAIFEVAKHEAGQERPDGRKENQARNTIFEGLGFVAINGTEDQRRQVVDTVDHNLANFIIDHRDQTVFARYFEIIFNYGNAEQQTHAADLILDYLNRDNYYDRTAGLDMAHSYFLSFSNNTSNTSQDIVFERGKQVYDEFMSRMVALGLSARDLELCLLISGPEHHTKITNDADNIGVRAVDNLEMMIELEDQCPGICRVLREQYGIRNFFRYPPEVLIRQYKTLNQKMESIIVYVALDDNNRVTEDSNWKGKDKHNPLAKLHRQTLQFAQAGQLPDVRLLVYEVADGLELKSVTDQAQAMTPRHKLSCGIFSSHGDERPSALISYLHGPEYSHIGPEDVNKFISDASFDSGAPFIFTSCFGSNMAEALSRQGLHVTGAEGGARVTGYTITPDLDKASGLSLGAYFRPGDIIDTYYNGQKIS